jgi:hypothetical protein
MPAYKSPRGRIKSYVRFYNEKFYVLCELCAFRIYCNGGFVARGTMNSIENRRCQKCGNSLLRSLAV